MGPLAAALAGGGTGGAVGALIGALVGYGIPEERAKVYEQGIKEGGIVFGVTPRSDEDAEYIERGWTNARGEQIYRPGAVRGREAGMKRDEGIARGGHHGGAARVGQRVASAQTSADQMMGRHSVEGQVTRVDAKKGWVHVKTSDGTMIVHFPPADLQTMKKGDRITVSLALKDNGPAPK